MLFKKFSILLLLCCSFSFSQQTITVSGNQTLLSAYDAIQTTNNVINQSYVILIDAAEVEIGDFKSRTDLGGKWKKTGTSSKSITIKSSNNFYYPKLVKTDIGGATSRTYSIDFDGVENVHLEGLTFTDALAGVRFFNTSDSTIESCIFRIDTLSDNNITGGGAVIEIRGTVATNLEANNNVVTSNYIYATNQALDSIGILGFNKWHGLYIGEKTNNNTLEYNTIDDVLGNGIQIWHREVYANTIQHNFISVSNSEQDSLNVRHNILIGLDGNRPVSTYGNEIQHNFVNSNSELISSERFQDGYHSFSQNNLNNLLINFNLKGLNPENITQGNIEFEYNGNEITLDPRHFESKYPELNLKMIGAVSGNFHGTTNEMEIAVLYDSGNNTSEVHVFQEKDVHGTLFLKHLGQWWKSNPGSFDATQLAGRLLAGDFVGNNGLDDVVGLRDLGNGNSSIVVLSGNSNGSFSPNGSFYTRWEADPGSLDANQFTGRMVVGDFTGDNLLDIAGLRDEGNGNSTIRLFTGGIDGHFNPDGGTYRRWKSNPGSMDANQFTGRMVAADFTGDGLLDIAGLRDEGNGNSTIRLFTGRTDGHFNPNGYAYKRWESNPGSLDANQFTGRIVAGEYTGNSILDIVGLRDEGNGNFTIRLFSGGSDGHFNPDGYSYSRWSSALEEFSNEDLGVFLSGSSNSLRLFLHNKMEPKRFRVVSWEHDNGNFSKTDGLDLTPFIINYNSVQSTSLKSSLAVRTIDNTNLTNTFNMILYPNPVVSSFTALINDINGEILEINIFKLNGTQVFSKNYILRDTPSGQELNIDINLATGIYILEAKSNIGEVFSKKMIVQ
ncbi:T9SS type A sorting domain-containing protein [Maribacter sp.]